MIPRAAFMLLCAAALPLFSNDFYVLRMGTMPAGKLLRIER